MSEKGKRIVTVSKNAEVMLDWNLHRSLGWLQICLHEWLTECMIENILKRRKESDTYLTNVCRHCWSSQVMMKVDIFPELSASTVAFISCRGRQNVWSIWWMEVDN